MKEDLCEVAECDTPSAYLKIRYVDAETNSDLLFSDNALYKVSDIKIKSSLTGTLPFKVDSTDKNILYLGVVSQGNEVITLKLGDKAEDKIAIDSRVVKKDCCGSLLITRLTVNNKVICSGCEPYQVITIKK